MVGSLSGFLIGDAPGWRWLASAGTSARLHCMSDADDRYAKNLFDRPTDRYLRVVYQKSDLNAI